MIGTTIGWGLIGGLLWWLTGYSFLDGFFYVSFAIAGLWIIGNLLGLTLTGAMTVREKWRSRTPRKRSAKRWD